MNLFRAIVGLLLVFLLHIPRLIYLGLLASYAAAFNNRRTLTADPTEHLKRARKILRTGRLSEILYAAIEIRFALERMAQRELVFAEAASNRMLEEHNPLKKVKNLQRLEPDAAFFHEIWFVSREDGKRIKWAEYKPLDKVRVAQIQGRLGDLLHPKEGLLLGRPNDPWYLSTRAFLRESLEYLSEVHKGNAPFFSYKGTPQLEMVKIEKPS